jgi:lipopolysaccharide transport system ATP-binding protein
MGDVAIRAVGLSKQYRIGERRKYKALRDTLTDALYAPFRKAQSLVTGSDHSARKDSMIWALKDVSFEINHGEVVGVLGRNGAGKSTLLKILSRITEPTEGFVDLHGRVASLLEVGTGFHPELTGRENVYLNGSIMGMRKGEIDCKFDEIVAFAEIEQFLDTPVKFYSSGMHMRLAFAVAAHLEPEILLVDEVLAVGDAAFQKKCFDKMRDVRQEGRTILFVSHNMSALQSICHRGLTLTDGVLTMDGDIDSVADRYLSDGLEKQTFRSEVQTANFVVHDVEIYSTQGSSIRTFDPVVIRIRFTAKNDVHTPGLYVAVFSLANQRLSALDLRDFCSPPFIPAGHTSEMGFTVESLPLLPGKYKLEIQMKKDVAGDECELLPQTVLFDVVESPVYGGRKLDEWHGHFGLRASAYVID